MERGDLGGASSLEAGVGDKAGRRPFLASILAVVAGTASDKALLSA